MSSSSTLASRVKSLQGTHDLLVTCRCLHIHHNSSHLAECAQLSDAKPAANTAWGLVGWALGALGDVLRKVGGCCCTVSWECQCPRILQHGLQGSAGHMPRSGTSSYPRCWRENSSKLHLFSSHTAGSFAQGHNLMHPPTSRFSCEKEGDQGASEVITSWATIRAIKVAPVPAVAPFRPPSCRAEEICRQEGRGREGTGDSGCVSSTWHNIWTCIRYNTYHRHQGNSRLLRQSQLEQGTEQLDVN
jgi:hypothetical protein